MLNGNSEAHANLMDETYRHQRLIYDLTRKYYLFGRDRLIERLAPREGAHVLEVACGTGRNLQMAARKYPGCTFYGLDISSEMLRTARVKLTNHVQLARADACDFDASKHFQREAFDRIFISYGISMMPDWEQALRTTTAHLDRGGELHVVDFSDQSGWPTWFGAALQQWLTKFHVHPRLLLHRALDIIAAETGGTVHYESLYRGYAQYGVLRRPQ